MKNLKRQIAAFHQLVWQVHGVRCFTYAENGTCFEVVADDELDFGMIKSVVQEENELQAVMLRLPAVH